RDRRRVFYRGGRDGGGEERSDQGGARRARYQARRAGRTPSKAGRAPAGAIFHLRVEQRTGWRGRIYEPPSWRKLVTWYACPMSTGFENEARWNVPWPRPRSFLRGQDLSAGRSSRAGRDFRICPARDVALSRLLAGRRGL